MTAFGGLREAERCIEIVRTVAAAEIMPRFRRLAPGAVRAKSAPDDLVTEADLAAEDAISRALARDFPEAHIVGEEAAGADPSLLDRLSEAELAFVIDPVDGTWNYASGLAVFGVILAVVAKGRTVMGLLYDPVMDDWVIARAGAGAWFGRGGVETPRRLVLSGGGTPSKGHGFVSPFNFPPSARARLAAQLAGFGRVEGLRCSCHEYRLLVQGRVSFCLSGSVHVWDHAAGALAVAEAGGAARMLDGADYTPVLRAGRLVAADGDDLLDDLARRFAWLEAEAAATARG